MFPTMYGLKYILNVPGDQKFIIKLNVSAFCNAHYTLLYNGTRRQVTLTTESVLRSKDINEIAHCMHNLGSYHRVCVTNHLDTLPYCCRKLKF